eukprot:14041568-Heterocapsa_arctica.AAC.1
MGLWLPRRGVRGGVRGQQDFPTPEKLPKPRGRSTGPFTGLVRRAAIPRCTLLLLMGLSGIEPLL